jgi:hypothetical protein
VTRTISRRMGALVAFTLLAGVAVSAGQGAQAYPPGTHLKLVADRASVPVTQKVTLTASHVGPGCHVKFTFGSQQKSTSSSHGTAQVTFTSTATHGVIHASATTFGCPFHETANTSVKASSPAIKLPDHVRKNHPFAVTIYQFPALTNIKVRVYNGHFSKTLAVKTGSGGTAMPTFNVPTAGSYLVVASGGGASASVVLHVYNS